MSAKGKYCQEIVDEICHAIALTGSDRGGFEAGGIGHDTFYRWLRDKKDFSERVAKAKKEYRENYCPLIQRRQANRAFADYLFGRIEETWDTTEKIVNDDGSETLKYSTKKVKKGVPQWAIERVLGKPTDLIDAVKILMSHGIFTPETEQRLMNELTKFQEGTRKAIEALGERASAGDD